MDNPLSILITGGTVFVSRYAAEYFVERGHNVFVLNRNTRQQPRGAKPIIADRNALGDVLKDMYFDVVIDINAYNAADIINLTDAVGGFGKYIMISSSAVYPENTALPFKETAEVGPNGIWGDYGTGKIAAERALAARVPNAYIIRPPYIYGEYNNIYREAFVFDCANADLPMYIPADENFKLQFVHVGDVCRFIETLIFEPTKYRIFNIGTRPVTALEYVTACYAAVGKTPTVKYVDTGIAQRNYFPFHAYTYELDCSRANELMPDQIELRDGLKRAYKQYTIDGADVKRKDYLQFIRENFSKRA